VSFRVTSSSEPDGAPEPSDPFGGERLDLAFPCPWTYTVIGEDELELRVAVTEIVGSLEHTFSFSHRSRAGKYRSFQLEVNVPSDEERLRIFRELHESDWVVYVF